MSQHGMLCCCERADVAEMNNAEGNEHFNLLLEAAQALAAAAVLHKPDATWGTIHFTEPISGQHDFVLISEADINRLKSVRQSFNECYPDARSVEQK